MCEKYQNKVRKRPDLEGSLEQTWEARRLCLLPHHWYTWIWEKHFYVLIYYSKGTKIFSLHKIANFVRKRIFLQKNKIIFEKSEILEFYT